MIHLRMCVATRMLKPKTELFRLVKIDGKIVVDQKQKMQGRGVFVSKDVDVIKNLKKSKALNKAFKMEIDPSVYEQLEELCQKEA